ncbi:MAG: site-2 protease family protein [Anaerolineae bacterium]
MGTSLRIATIAGIDIKLHWSFLLIVGWAVLRGLRAGSVRAVALSLAFILLLFFFVTLHELGHALSAVRFRVQVKDIVLLPIGGVAQMRSLPEKPWQELVIALAGPLVNLFIAFLAGLVMLIVWGPGLALGLTDSSGAILYSVSRVITGGGNSLTVLAWIALVNGILAIFNLFPAFPMDGGRVLRSLLAMVISFPRATRIAARLGQGLAVLLMSLAIWRGNFSLLFVAVFVFLGATYENFAVQTRWSTRHLRVADALRSGALIRLAPDQLVSDVMDLSFRWPQHDFPVVEGNTFLGLVLHRHVVEAVQAGQGTQSVATMMQRDVPSVTPEDGLWLAQRFMAEANLSSLPVLVGGVYVGLISLRDINAAYVRSANAGRL